ncbi:MAG: tetratricopeptide repeat protein [Bacteroidia bacterium]|nr:tetratricopeptide repeat protein [Bacteroidia bacterium]
MNKLIILFTIVVSLACMFSSCETETQSTDTVKKDTVVVDTPEELLKLNAEIAKNPKDADLLHKRALYFLEKQEINDGIIDMIDALNIDSTKSDYYVTISNLYFLGNKTGKAKVALERAVSLDEKNIEALLKLAELYLYVSKNEKSIEAINKVLRLDQYNAKAYFMKGMNYKELKDTAKAISSMQTAVEQDQLYYQAFMQLGILCAAKNNPLAVQYYKNAIRLNPKSVEAIYGLGKYYQDTEDFKNALLTYNTILEFDRDKYTHYNIAVIHLVNSKKYDLSITHFSEAIAIDPKYVEAYYGRGVTYQTQGNKTAAINDFKACLALNGDYELAKIELQKLGVK